MNQVTGEATVEQTLNKTDFGHVLYENRKLFFGLLIAIVVGVTGYVIYGQSKKSSALNTSVEVFEFQSKTWAEAKAGKIAPAELASAFEKLDSKVQSAPVMLPVVLDMGKFLYEKGNYVEADQILSKVSSSTKHNVTTFFITMQRVVVLEKLGKSDEAISLLENLLKAKDGLLPARGALELGRLYLAKGEKGKAQTQFDYVVSTFPNDEHAKMAKLYLSQLSK